MAVTQVQLRDGTTKDINDRRLIGLTANVTELNYTDGVTSNIQTQLNTKQSNLTVNPATTTANLTSIGINGTNYALAGGTQVIWRTY